MSEPASETVEKSETPDFHLRAVAYHEAAHAVVDWNLGFGVKWVQIDRVRFGGRMLPAKSPKDRATRLAYAVGTAAGLASIFYFTPRLRAEDVFRARVDLYRVQWLLQPPLNFTHGEQLGVSIELTYRVRELLAAPEVRKQIESLAKPLMRDGRLFESQVHARLERHPATTAARRRCRDFVAELEPEIDQVFRSAQGYAPDFAWPSDTP